MSLASRNSNRKSKSHNQLNRVMFFDQLEDRRLMAGNLNGYVVGERAYFKCFHSSPAAEVAPASKTTTSTAATEAAAVAVLTVETAEGFNFTPVTPEFIPHPPVEQPEELTVPEVFANLPAGGDSSATGELTLGTAILDLPGVTSVIPEFIPHQPAEPEVLLPGELPVAFPVPDVRADLPDGNVVLPTLTSEGQTFTIELPAEVQPEAPGILPYCYYDYPAEVFGTAELEVRADQESFTGTTYLNTPDLSGLTVVVSINPEVPASSPLFGTKIPVLGGDEAEAGTYEAETHLLELQNTNVSTSGDWGAASYKGTTRVLSASGKVTLDDDWTKGKLGVKVEGDASLFKTEHEGEYAAPIVTIGGMEVSSTKVKGNATAMVGVSGSASAGVAWNGTDAGVKIEAEVFAGAQVKGDGSVENRTLGVKSEATGEGIARAGAEASSQANVTAGEGVDVNAKAFAGAKAGGETGASVAGIGVSIDGEAWAGAGAEAGITSKMEDGKFKLKADLGAAVGAGGKVGFGIEVDPSEVAKLVYLPAHFSWLYGTVMNNPEFRGFLNSTDATFENAADQVYAELGSFGSDVSNVVNQAANEVSNVASQAGNAIADTATSGWNSFVSLF